MSDIIYKTKDSFRENIYNYIALAIVFILISLSFFNINSLQIGNNVGQDLPYHMLRVKTLALEMQDGNIPFYNSGYRGYGYGILDFVFYPYLFLYIPAYLYTISKSLVFSMNIFIILVNFSMVLSMYKSAKLIFKQSNIATLATAIYCLNYMSLWNTHERFAVGEVLAMVFMPMVIAGFYSIIFTEEKKSIYFILGFTGLIQSHVITTLYIGIFTIIGLFILSNVIIKNKNTLIKFLKSFLWILILNIGFLYPFIVSIINEKNIAILNADNMNHFVNYRDFISIFSKIPFFSAHESLFSQNEALGRFSLLELSLLIITIVLYILIYVMKQNDYFTKVGLTFLVITIMYLVLTLWTPMIIENNKVLADIITRQQFSMQYLIRMIPFMSLAMAYPFSKMKFEMNKLTFIVIILLALSGRALLNYNLFDENYKLYKDKNIENMNLLNIVYDYAPQYDDIVNGDTKLLNGKIESNGIIISNEKKEKLSYECDYTLSESESHWIEFPFHNFKNFKCIVNDKEVKLENDRNRYLWIRIPEEEKSGHLSLYCVKPKEFMLCFYTSIISIFAFAGICLSKKR